MPSFLLNPWLIRGVLCAILLGTGYFKGRSSGIESQRQKDQASIQAVVDQIAANKAEANRVLLDAHARLADTQRQAAELNNKLETERNENRKTTDDLRRALASASLRYYTDHAGTGSSGANPMPSQGSSTSNAKPAIVELPETIARPLREIAYDCDTLRDDYRVLWDFTR